MTFPRCSLLFMYLSVFSAKERRRKKMKFVIHHIPPTYIYAWKFIVYSIIEAWHHKDVIRINWIEPVVLHTHLGAMFCCTKEIASCSISSSHNSMTSFCKHQVHAFCSGIKQEILVSKTGASFCKILLTLVKALPPEIATLTMLLFCLIFFLFFFFFCFFSVYMIFLLCFSSIPFKKEYKKRVLSFFKNKTKPK